MFIIFWVRWFIFIYWFSLGPKLKSLKKYLLNLRIHIFISLQPELVHLRFFKLLEYFMLQSSKFEILKLFRVLLSKKYSYIIPFWFLISTFFNKMVGVNINTIKTTFLYNKDDFSISVFKFLTSFFQITSLKVNKEKLLIVKLFQLKLFTSEINVWNFRFTL